MGKLGFLADVSTEQLPRVLPQVAKAECRVVSHMMFTTRVLRAGNALAESLGLNETAVLGGPPYQMLEIDLYVDAQLATTYSCDGLIVSTPVGSTAHSLSAGGPILRKDLQAFVFLPISPHTLTHRPVIDSADRTIELAVPEPNAGTTLVVDGRVLATLEADDRVKIVRSEARFQLVEVSGQSYYGTLHDKLGWAGQFQLEK
jgi:NAD+ kinase